MTVASNQREINFVFRPVENKAYSGNIAESSLVLLSALSFPVSGEGFLDSYDVLAQGGETWDLFCYLLHSRQDKLLKIWQENKHLSDADKRNFSVLGNTPFFHKKLTDEEKSEGVNAKTNNVPPWKQ